MVLAFFVQQQLVKYLGYDLVGVNRTCTSIIAMLSVAELGLGSAITFSLYEPLAQKKQEKIAALIRLYRKIYIGLAIIITIGVAVTMPFIKQFTQSQYDLKYLCLVYGLFALNTVVTYFFSYNQTLLVADQREYITTIVLTVTTILTYVLQFAVLYCLKYFAEQAKLFFLIYLAISIVLSFVGNAILYVIVKKKYPYISSLKKQKLGKEDKSELKRKIGALIYHRVGGYFVSGTDTLIITGFLTSAVSGITSNYYTITTSLNTLLSKLPSALLPGFGNLVVEADGKKIYSVYKKAQFPIYVLFAVAGIGATVLSDLFIGRIWLGSDGLMDITFTILLGTNFFITGYTMLMSKVRYAAGVFEPDKYFQIIVAVIHLIISILLVRIWGAAGVLCGTLICLIINESSVLPFICCKYVFKISYLKFLTRQWGDYLLYGLLCVVCWFICSAFELDGAIAEFIVKGIICVVIPVSVICLVYWRSAEFKYYRKALIRMIKSILSKMHKPPVSDNTTGKVEDDDVKSNSENKENISFEDEKCDQDAAINKQAGTDAIEVEEEKSTRGT